MEWDGMEWSGMEWRGFVWHSVGDSVSSHATAWSRWQEAGSRGMWRLAYDGPCLVPRDSRVVTHES